MFPVLDETFMSQPSVEPATATFTNSSQTRTLTVCHQIRHSPRQRLGQMKDWPGLVRKRQSVVAVVQMCMSCLVFI